MQLLLTWRIADVTGYLGNARHRSLLIGCLQRWYNSPQFVIFALLEFASDVSATAAILATDTLASH